MRERAGQFLFTSVFFVGIFACFCWINGYHKDYLILLFLCELGAALNLAIDLTRAGKHKKTQ